MSVSLRTRLAFAFAVAAVSVGCATPGVNIVTLRPGSIEPKGADRIVLVDGEGRRKGREEVADLMREEARGGFYSFDDRGDDGVKMVLVGKEGKIEGNTKGARSNELYVRIDVLVWEASPAIIKSETQDGTIVEEPGIHGRADLQMSVIEADGTVLMTERPYLGIADVVDDGRSLPERVIEQAARTAIRGFLNEISPVRMTETVRYDDGDPGQEKILKRSLKDPLNMVERDFRRYIKKNDGNAIAIYNLAVVLDAEGKFEAALEKYDEAMKIVVRPQWRETREACAQRLRAWKLVYGAREKPKKAPVVDDSADAKAKTETAPPAP